MSHKLSHVNLTRDFGTLTQKNELKAAKGNIRNETDWGFIWTELPSESKSKFNSFSLFILSDFQVSHIQTN